MFDGNFRSAREVNLSGNSRRRGRTAQQQSNKRNSTGNKQDLLKHAEIQRKQRQEQQRRERSARLIQRVIRGHQCRLRVLKSILKEETTTNHHITSVSICLSLLHLLKHKQQGRPQQQQQQQQQQEFPSKSYKEVLLEYAETQQQQQQQQQQSETNNGCQNNNDSIWFSRRRVVQMTLRELTPDDTDEMERQALLSILRAYLPSLSVTVPLFLDLATCFQKWWTRKETMTHEITTALCQWAMEAAKSPNFSAANLSKAVLATIFLSGPSCAKVDNIDFVYTTWILPLVDILQSQEQNSNSNNNNNSNDSSSEKTKDETALAQAIMKNLQGGKEQKVLSNILDIQSQQQQQDPRPIIQLMHHMLWKNSSTNNENSSHDVTVLAALLARGDNLDQSASSHASGWGDENNINDDDDDDDSEHDDDENPNSHLDNTKKLRANSRYTRKDLLTILKLDRIYQDQIQQLKNKEMASNNIDPEAKELAQKIVNAPWLKWGLEIFNSEDDWSMVPSFVESLACLLQATTSLRPSAKLNVLSPVAFSKPFMEKLWYYCKTTGSFMATAVFCDLFAHYLIALSDVNFLKYHTPKDDISMTQKSLMAEDVIVQLRTLLYELYWSKPVMVSEIQVGNERGRLILSGTKLWNSLYERWNRLLRQPFCDESAWWFPHLSSKEGDRAVLPDQEGDDDDSMDIDDDDGAGISAAEAETDALADTFRDPKMARILTCIPQALPFDRRVKLFNSLLKADKRKALNAAISNRSFMRMMQGDDGMFFGNIREQVKIRRAALYQDSMDQLNSMGPRLKHQIQVSFVNQHGAEEAGIDGGGVFKEFLDDLIKDGFAVKNDDDTGGTSDVGAPPLFAVTPLQTLAVNFDMSENDSMLQHYEFVGRVLGKAVYESILVEPQFCLPFLNQLLAKPNTMEDLKNYDEEYYKNLTKLRELSETEIDSLGLTFELTVSSGSTKNNHHTQPRTVELIPGGRSVPVTKKNVFQYIHLVAHQLLNVQGARQTKAFLRGFRNLIPASWVRLFSANELQKLISGDDSVRGIDVLSLKNSMHYLGGYHISQPYIQDFWDILEHEFTPEQQRKFLRFMTSCSRQPLLGFASLDPVPSIQQIRLTNEELSTRNSKLPTSQTCMNLLKLPNYENRQLLKEKLLAAIESGAGFELT